MNSAYHCTQLEDAPTFYSTQWLVAFNSLSSFSLVTYVSYGSPCKACDYNVDLKMSLWIFAVWKDMWKLKAKRTFERYYLMIKKV